MPNNSGSLPGHKSNTAALEGVQAEIPNPNNNSKPILKAVIDLHKIGEKLAFNDTRERTNGQRSEGLLTVSPGGKGPAPHVHTRQLEGFEVLSGHMIAVVNGKEIVLHAGNTVIVHPNEAHTLKNGSQTEPLVAKFWYEPALNAEWMLQTMGEDAMKNGGDWAKVSLLPAMFMMYKLRHEYRIAGMPVWLQNVLFGIGAGLAKLTGAAKKVKLPSSLV